VSRAARARSPPLVQARVWGAGSGAADVAVGGGVALAAEVRAGRALTRWPYGELCWPAECEPHRPKEHLHSEPRLRHGAAMAALAAHRTNSA
jgi:hypothetical protein